MQARRRIFALDCHPICAYIYAHGRRYLAGSLIGETDMTYFVTALENTKARLIHSETRTTDASIAKLVADQYRAMGLIVLEWKEA